MTESDSATSFDNAGSLHQELNQNRTALGCVVTPHLVSPSPPCGALFQGHMPDLRDPPIQGGPAAPPYERIPHGGPTQGGLS